MSVLISGGCSYAYGEGLANRDDRYAQKVADYMDKELVDVSVPGASNDYIASCVIMGINRALSQGKQPSDIVVMVGWTSQARYEYYDTGVDLIMSVMAMVGPGTQHHKIGNVSRDQIVESMWGPSFGYYQFLRAYQRVDAHCKLLGIPVIHKQSINVYAINFRAAPHAFASFAQNEIINHALTPEQKKSVKHLLNQSSFQTMAAADKELDETQHPTSPSHFKWANLIIYDFEKTHGKMG
jgi:hypothetical protein